MQCRCESFNHGDVLWVAEWYIYVTAAKIENVEIDGHLTNFKGIIFILKASIVI